MLSCEREADNGDSENESQEQVYQRQFQPREDDPDDIHDHRHCSTGRFGVTNLLAERRKAQYGKLETLDSERYADDCQAQDNPTE